jgi:hypothetical protein
MVWVEINQDSKYETFANDNLLDIKNSDSKGSQGLEERLCDTGAIDS